MRPAANLPASRFAQVRQRAFEARETVDAMLTRYAIERLLYRLSVSEAGARYMLKGAMLFATWPEHARRPTDDLDLLGFGQPDEAAARALFAALCETPAPEDGLRFDPDSIEVEALREDEDYQGLRLRMYAYLGKARARLKVDIGFGDHVHPAPERRDYPLVLAGLPPARILMYPFETVIAEKFEALVDLGLRNSRMKDFYDLWIITKTFTVELDDLVTAVAGTLRRRETPFPVEMPAGLTEAFARSAAADHWTGWTRRTTPATEPPDLPDLLAHLRIFFGRVLEGLADPERATDRWNPDAGLWLPKA